MQVLPYLFFDGRCEEAGEFYRTALGAELLHVSRFSDNPEPAPGMVPPGAEQKIMHMSMRIGTTVLMASDGRCNGEPAKFEGFSLSLSPANEAEARRLFEAIADGGTVTMPLNKTFFSPCFGMVDDRFGVSWMIHCES